ncbi:MAG: STAS domain-containing protein [Planctomycetota bacterium]|jgi:anti-anti-sigma factor|nr:STAS domain-containing protein [Planctomycetota bacterium]MDA1026115.1 STAS domain-containing protein [Planctomycetota bacterium]
MSLNEWSETIILAETGEEPTFSDDMSSLMTIVEDAEQGSRGMPDVVVNLSEVDYLNSSNIAQLLRLRKRLTASGARLRICSVRDQVWGVILVTGLDKLFEFHDATATAIASLQLEA